MVPGKTTQWLPLPECKAWLSPFHLYPLTCLFPHPSGKSGETHSLQTKCQGLLRRPSTNHLKEYFTYQNYLSLAVREGFIPAGGGVTMCKIEGKLLIQISTETAFQTFTITRELQQDKGLLVPAKARQTLAPLPNPS